MYYVYILYSKKDKNLYVGCTQDIKSRIEKHLNGNVKATKFRKPLILIYKEEHQDKTKAFNRERFLKSLWSSREKKKIKQEYLDNSNN